MNYDEKCQLLIIGDSTVGKTSLLYRYTEDKFSTQHLATVGIDYFTKDEDFDNKLVRIKVWDTAGQERYKSLTSAFFRNAQGIILVYDVSNIETFENLKYWIQSIDLNLGEKNDIKKIIVGNKIDLEREVPKTEAENFAKQKNVAYYETSAKQNIGINESISFWPKL
jgi:small GTP-binding protein